MVATSGSTFIMGAEKQLSFSAFILGLASSALIHLGVTPNPETQTISTDLRLARQSIDILALLGDKTRGNLTFEEEQLFASTLADLRLRFVEKSASKG